MTKQGEPAMISRRSFLGAAAATPFLLVGCGQKTEENSRQEEMSQRPLSILVPGDADAEACQQIASRINEKLRDRLGASIELEQVPLAGYTSEIWNRMVCQTMPDLCLLTEDQPLTVYLNRNGILPLSQLLKGRPKLEALFSQDQWASRTYYRRVYAIPANGGTTYRVGFVARSDWMEELGACAEQITDWNALHELLERVYRQYPGSVPVVSDLGRTFPFDQLDPLGDTFGVLTSTSGVQVVNWYAGEEYHRLCNRMRQWYREGLILHNASLREEAATDLMHQCGGFGFFAYLNEDRMDRYTRAYGASLTAIPLGPKIRNSSIPAENWCLPVTEGQREKALLFLELLYTDMELYKLFVIGEEGVGWKNLWMNATGLLRDEETKELQLSPAYPFCFRNTDVSLRVDACRGLKELYHNALTCGYLDPEDALPEFLQKLEEAGIREIMELKQRQLDAWIGSS